MFLTTQDDIDGVVHFLNEEFQNRSKNSSGKSETAVLYSGISIL